MEWIDSHCHLQAFSRRGQLDDVLRRAAEKGVTRMITIGTSVEDWGAYRELCRGFPGQIDYTVGLHPTSVGEDWREQVAQLSTYFIPPFEPVGLGEIGLDHFHLPRDPIEAAQVITRQEEAFAAQLELALQLDCPVVVHSRQAVPDCIRLIEESGIDWRRVVFHCWADGPELAADIVRRGARASFTGIVTYKSAENVREAARAHGVDRLMVETDCPYLAPIPHRGRENEPAYVRHTGERLAHELGLAIETMAKRTTENTREFFRLS